MSKQSLSIEKDLKDFIIKEVEEREFERKHRVKRFKYHLPISVEVANAITHGIGALIAIAQLVILIVFSEGALAVTSVTIFGSTSILLFVISTLYHAFVYPGTTKSLFKRFDHIAIYMLIAGTYTPFALLAIGGAKGWTLFGIQWGLAAIGIVFKSIWIRKYHAIHVVIYLLMGWCIAYFGPQDVYQFLGFDGFMLLLGGGLAYTIGVIFYVFPITKYHHAIWHLFVILGNVLHFFCLLFYVI